MNRTTLHLELHDLQYVFINHTNRGGSFSQYTCSSLAQEMAEINLDTLLRQYKIENDEDVQVSPIHLEKISRFYSIKLRNLSHHLGMEWRDGHEERLKFFSDWKQEQGTGATYKTLIAALLNIGCKNDAERVCNLLKPRPPPSHNLENTGRKCLL